MSLDERLKYAAMKARHKNILKPWYKKWWGISIIIVLILTFVLLSLCSLYVINQVRRIVSGQTETMTEQERQNYLKAISGDGTNYYLGSTSPQAVMIEFGDFACPYCKESSPIISKLAVEYKDKIKVVWRDYLRNSDSIDLAMTGRCAGEQGKFWEMHDLLFQNQDSLTTADNSRQSKLIALAGALKLDTEKFTDCLTNKKYLTQIKKDYEDGNKLEIVGTPTWFVNNYQFSGALSEQKFRELITGIVK